MLLRFDDGHGLGVTKIQREREGLVHRSFFHDMMVCVLSVSRKAGKTPALGLIGIHWESRVIPPAWMCDVISAPAQRAAVPGVEELKDQRRMNSDRGLEALRRLPCAIANAGNTLPIRACGMQGHSMTVACDDESIASETARLDLHPLERTIHVAYRTSLGRL